MTSLCIVWLVDQLMDAYCTREGLPADGVRFLYDGERINRDNTPQELDMQDQDEIDVRFMA